MTVTDVTCDGATAPAAGVVISVGVGFQANRSGNSAASTAWTRSATACT